MLYRLKQLSPFMVSMTTMATVFCEKIGIFMPMLSGWPGKVEMNAVLGRHWEPKVTSNHRFRFSHSVTFPVFPGLVAFLMRVSCTPCRPISHETHVDQSGLSWCYWRKGFQVVSNAGKVHHIQFPLDIRTVLDVKPGIGMRLRWCERQLNKWPLS